MAERLRTRHGAHTVVLYGSRARGEATATSDYDLLGIAPVDRTIRDAAVVDGHFLDAFVMAEAALCEPDESLVYMHGGCVIFERDGAGTRLLAALAERHARGPTPVTDDNAAMRRVWVHKMLDRIARGDAEAHLRRAMLLSQLIEDYFALRGQWYEGPRRGLLALERDAPELFRLYVSALSPNADFEAVRACGLAFAA